MVKTPNNLQLRFDKDDVFSSIAKLWIRDKRVNAKKILITCEQINDLPSFFSFANGILSIIAGWNIWVIFAVVIFSKIGGYSLLYFRDTATFNLLHITLPLHKPFHKLQGYGIYFIVGLIVSYYMGGLTIVFAWSLASFSSYLVTLLMDFLKGKQSLKLYDYTYGRAEISFLLALKFYCRKLKIDFMLMMRSEKLISHESIDCYFDYIEEYPYRRSE